MRRIAACSAMAVMVLVATPANAALEIKRIAFDPAGADSGTNRHLNKEWIKIKNTGRRTRTLDGFKLHDRGRDHSYVFADESRGDDVFTNIRLGPGEYVRLHTGRGQDAGTTGCNGHCFTYYDFYWDLDNYVWNNDGDRATLKRPNGTAVDRCAYSGSAASPVSC